MDDATDRITERKHEKYNSVRDDTTYPQCITARQGDGSLKELVLVQNFSISIRTTEMEGDLPQRFISLNCVIGEMGVYVPLTKETAELMAGNLKMAVESMAEMDSLSD